MVPCSLLKILDVSRGTQYQETYVSKMWKNGYSVSSCHVIRNNITSTPNSHLGYHRSKVKFLCNH